MTLLSADHFNLQITTIPAEQLVTASRLELKQPLRTDWKHVKRRSPWKQQNLSHVKRIALKTSDLALSTTPLRRAVIAISRNAKSNLLFVGGGRGIRTFVQIFSPMGVFSFRVRQQQQQHQQRQKRQVRGQFFWHVWWLRICEDIKKYRF